MLIYVPWLPGSLAGRMLCHVRAWPELLALTAPCCQGSWGRWGSQACGKRRFIKEQCCLGHPELPVSPAGESPSLLNTVCSCPGLTSVGAGHSPTVVPPVPDIPGVPVAANQDKRGRAATMDSTDSGAGLPQTPKVSPRVIPHGWGCAFHDPKETLAKPQTSAQCIR